MVQVVQIGGREVIWTKYKRMHFFSGTLPLVLVINDQKSRFVTGSFQLRGSKDDGDNRFWGGCCASVKSKFDFNYTFDNAEIRSDRYRYQIDSIGWSFLVFLQETLGKEAGRTWRQDNKTITHEIMEVCTHSEQVFLQPDKVCSEQTKLPGFCTDNQGALNSCLCAVEQVAT